MGDPTRADEWLAAHISRKVGEDVSPRRIERLREAGLVRLHRPGSHEHPGREEGTYLPPMVEQSVAVVLALKQERNLDRIGMRLFLSGYEIAPSALRRFFLGTPTRPGLFGTASTSPEGFESPGEESEWADVARTPEGALLEQLLGAFARDFLAYAAELALGGEDVPRDPNPAVARAMGLPEWAPKVDYDAEPGPDEIGQVPPPEAVAFAMRLQAGLQQAPHAIQQSDESDWHRARADLWLEWDRGEVIAALDPDLREAAGLREPRLALNLVSVMLLFHLVNEPRPEERAS